MSEHPNNLRYGKPGVEDGNEKMMKLLCSKEVEKLLQTVKDYDLMNIIF